MRPPPLWLTIEDAKQRVLGNNKLLQLAAMNVQSKAYATKAVKANYFPQIVGSTVYFQFNDSLGDVLTTGGRTVSGPRGRPLGAIPALTIEAPLIEQDSSFSTITAVQPITDLLKVRAGVQIGRADEGIAQAQMEKGTRELVSGVEELFRGLLAAQRIRGGLLAGAGAIEAVAKTGNLEARTALLQGQQSLQEVTSQIADLEGQMLTLLDLPLCTKIELVEPGLLIAPVQCCEEAVSLALETSPEIHEAQHNVDKANAAVAAGKVDCLSNIAIVGGYANNNMLSVVQPNIGYIGLVGTYTFVDWGKRRNTIHEREEFVAMANLKVRQLQDDVRQKTSKAFRDYETSATALKLAAELVELRKEAMKAAAPVDQMKIGKDLLTAEVDSVKADLNLGIAYVKLMAIMGKQ